MKISSSPGKTRAALFIVLVISLTIFLAGCSVLQSAGPVSGDTSDDDSQYESQEQALESDDGVSADESSAEDLPLTALTCPKKPMEFILVAAHDWDYSPNRDPELAQINGMTGMAANCPLTVHGRKVTMEDCQVYIVNTGFVQTDEGKCDISSSGAALITTDEAYCDKGKVIITIIESIDTDAGSAGAMNCPGFSQGWFAFFPHSLTTKSFDIQEGGSTKIDYMDPDFTGQFRYHKEWTLYILDDPAIWGN